MRKVFFIFIVLFFTACSKDNYIERDKFTDIYAETLIISANTSLSDYGRKQKIDSLLSVNHLTATDFKSTADKFSGNPAEWKEIYKEIIEKIETRKQRKN